MCCVHIHQFSQISHTTTTNRTTQQQKNIQYQCALKLKIIHQCWCSIFLIFDHQSKKHNCRCGVLSKVRGPTSCRWLRRLPSSTARWRLSELALTFIWSASRVLSLWSASVINFTTPVYLWLLKSLRCWTSKKNFIRTSPNWRLISSPVSNAPKGSKSVKRHGEKPRFT